MKEKVREAISGLENSVMPENISNKLMDAVKTFVDQYSKQETINLEGILKNINIFKAS